uniref:Uncharacterized protein n=1 Tax=Oryza nivara TaxID=4536 RepID=A0A0E0GJE5_ORYNI
MSVRSFFFLLPTLSISLFLSPSAWAHGSSICPARTAAHPSTSSLLYLVPDGAADSPPATKSSSSTYGGGGGGGSGGGVLRRRERRRDEAAPSGEVELAEDTRAGRSSSAMTTASLAHPFTELGGSKLEIYSMRSGLASIRLWSARPASTS